MHLDDKEKGPLRTNEGALFNLSTASDPVDRALHIALGLLQVAFGFLSIAFGADVGAVHGVANGALGLAGCFVGHTLGLIEHLTHVLTPVIVGSLPVADRI